MKTGPADVSDPVMERLRMLVHDYPDLKGVAGYYDAVLPLINTADLGAEPVRLTPEEANNKMEAGVPLIQGLSLSFDITEAGGLMLRIAEAIGNVPGQNHRDVHRIRKALEEETLDISELISHVAAGEREIVISDAESLHLDAGLLLTLAEYSLRPALRMWQRQLEPLTKGIPWDRGYCYICGASPTLAELQGNVQAKHLRCGRCGADWPYPRLRCSSCGNEDHRSLGLLYSEKDREKMRVEFCDNCRGYIKVIASYSPTPAGMIAVEDLATLYLDYVAQERGYVKGGVRRPK